MKKFLFTLAITLSYIAPSVAKPLPLKLWYKNPALYFEESLLIGNGRLGGVVYGGVKEDKICLNDITLWTGKPVNRNQDEGAYKWIEPIREALRNENYKLADSLQLRVQGPNSQYYQPLATLSIINNQQENYKNYYRELSLDSSLVKVHYEQNGIRYQKEYFATNPDKAIVVRLSANKAGAISCKLSLNSLVPHQVNGMNNGLMLSGHAYGDPNNSIHFRTLLYVKNKGGKVLVTDSVVSLNKVSSAEIYIVNETSFNGYDKHPVLQGKNYQELAQNNLNAILKRSYNSIKTRHIQDYKQLFDRVRFSLNDALFNNKQATDEQLKEYTIKKESNPYLEMLYFQFGRYLLISSSRTLGVPANLQGLWATRLFSPWRANYTVNINLEENYWCAEVANLSEMFQPLNSFVKGLADTGIATAKNYYGISKGWCACHNSDIWAMTNPVGEKRESPEWANWNLGGAWLMSHLWEHFLYTQDLNYLKTEAYPLMKGACEFMFEWLVRNHLNPNEWITTPSTSPENNYKLSDGYQGKTCFGGTADLAILRELFTNTAEAARLLNTDTAFSHKLLAVIAEFHPYTIGKEGDLNEWYYDWNDADIHHRHQSHLIGLFPGHHLSLQKTPSLAQAARRTLEIKGDKTTGWSSGWRLNLWARLKDGHQSYHTYRTLLNYVSPDEYKEHDRLGGGGTYPNLLDAHPPFQIDGNFGGTAGVCEMLLQSGNDVIELLPALPQSWKDGSMVGLRTRGAYVVSFQWKDHKVTNVSIKSEKGGHITLKVNQTEMPLTFKLGETKNLLLAK